MENNSDPSDYSTLALPSAKWIPFKHRLIIQPKKVAMPRGCSMAECSRRGPESYWAESHSSIKWAPATGLHAWALYSILPGYLLVPISQCCPNLWGRNKIVTDPLSEKLSLLIYRMTYLTSAMKAIIGLEGPFIGPAKMKQRYFCYYLIWRHEDISGNYSAFGNWKLTSGVLSSIFLSKIFPLPLLPVFLLTTSFICLNVP